MTLQITNNGVDTFDIADAQAMLKEHIYIRSNMAKLLASVIKAGYEQEAIVAVLAWGEGKKPIEQIWKELSTLLENTA